jgi:hypothetical protein
MWLGCRMDTVLRHQWDETHTWPVLASHIGSTHSESKSSVQSLAAPEHMPLLQISSMVHRLPSSQAMVLGLILHFPVLGSQESVVQGLLSSQIFSVPAHTPAPLHLQQGRGTE